MIRKYSIFSFVAFLAVWLLNGAVRAQDNGDAMNADVMTPETNMEAAASDHVARAVFTSAVQNREPTDTVTSLSNTNNKIYFFSELTGLGGQTVTHRWEYQGKTMGEVKFDVGGPRWRVWSSKTLLPQWTGEWRVSIIDGAGNKVGEGTFNYTDTGAPSN